MSVPRAAPWPPPPDLHSIQELVRDADVEGLIQVHGAPDDEYEPEATQIFTAIQHLTTSEITVPGLLPTLETVWRKNFALDDHELTLRHSALCGLAQQIARFFGPEAQPKVRS